MSDDDDETSDKSLTHGLVGGCNGLIVGVLGLMGIHRTFLRNVNLGTGSRIFFRISTHTKNTQKLIPMTLFIL